MESFYERVGGSPVFTELVSQFYAQVAVDPVLRPMYPDEDFKGAAHRLQMFLEQYWGGPTTYSEERGHPRLRMRHADFHIASLQRDAWLKCMRTAVHGLGLAKDLEIEMLEYMQLAAESLVNQRD